MLSSQQMQNNHDNFQYLFMIKYCNIREFLQPDKGVYENPTANISHLEVKESKLPPEDQGQDHASS